MFDYDDICLPSIREEYSFRLCFRLVLIVLSVLDIFKTSAAVKAFQSLIQTRK